MEKTPEIDGVAFALGKLTEALLEQIHATKVAETNVREQDRVIDRAQTRLRARTRELEEAFTQAEKYQTQETVLDADVRRLVDRWKKEDEE